MIIKLQKKFLDDVKKILQDGGVGIENKTYYGERLTFKSYAEINKFLGDNCFKNKNDFIFYIGYLTAKSGYMPIVVLNNKSLLI